ncbi:putative lipoxygenase 5 [Carex littledalei]|uniref:Putative lipoxygenase 5 n=1 Tax=Carex littledalei TaxID=544730 RepID=A0A833RG33_9POAL|nr:putative lipoxygenase 5 [Carex littledalei]
MDILCRPFTGEGSKLCFSSSRSLNSRQRRGVVRRMGLRSPMASATVERMVASEAIVEKEKAVNFMARAVVTVRRKRREDLKETIANQFDAYSEKMIWRSVLLELIGTEIDLKTGGPKTSKRTNLKGWFDKKDLKAEKVVYTAEFMVDSSFGEPGAITILNRHQREFFLENIEVQGFPTGTVHFTCDSWIQPIRIRPNKRIFFTNKPYLPSETPLGLRRLREMELMELRGDGKGERKMTDRIYDYDIYNDLGNPDKGTELVRPNIGGNKALPYPRRLRTGRPPSETDEMAESRIEYPEPIYIPHDEEFEEKKLEMLADGDVKALLHNLVPLLVSSLSPETNDFKGFHDIDNLFKEGLRLKQALQDYLLEKIPFVTKIQASEGLLRYDTPHILRKDKFAWLRDDEFARQALAGINPVNIERLQAFPPVSKLDPDVYGPPESAIKEEHIIGHLNGMSVQQALENSRLYMLDFHDIYLPFLDKINAQDGRKAYGTRTIFFLTDLGTLKPISIELCLPPATPNCARAKRVLTPPTDATSNWLWQLAKAHLSIMHPIFKLLKPHMRYNLKINSIARQILISGGGVIESGFTPGKYCVEMSSAAYRDLWRFDQEDLPSDLIRRGMAVPDHTEPHGLRLLIKDYPYATDGLLLWSAIEKFVQSYVATYYPTSQSILSDTELQSWYAESVQVGHADHKSAPWWPQLTDQSNLVSILTKLIWLASAQHAALNFGQYPLGGYVPNRPPLMRRLVPVETDPEYKNFVADPHRFFLSALPGLTQMTTFMTVIDTLSTHSKDEEYLGERDDNWTGDEEMVKAFKEFAKEIMEAEEEMERRNGDRERRNRCGAGVMPYELMQPSSEPGITCRGVPNSVTI